MNTVKSVYYGWGTLIVAGGGAYYFAKKSINADRAAKAEADHQKRMNLYKLEQQHLNNSPNSTPPAPRSVTSELGKKRGETGKRVDRDWHEGNDEAGKPSREASTDPAATRHAPEDEEGKMREKSKYEASDVYRSRKGDRFS
ncbi:hypothetical protein P280DRAFT_464945 [Massarina eburnea CBS 473.64]|uniref:Uncharacterized protein n=1 Tax=Massarina eburnea CBS 473.64 TaxID=1395130 RepID=A0A6A6SJG5_9PLEO|nr:hypothetical protein P280DRAFT_464945 [Massarina eburnea CBS 473.64]